MIVATHREPALKLIIGYKLVKGVASLLLAFALITALILGHTDGIHDLAQTLREHVARAWAVHLADAMLKATDPAHLAIVGAALGCDGLLTFVEGYGLYRGWRWAPWLVVFATGSLLPFEIVAIVRKVRFGRVVVFLVNLAIVVYLARRTLREVRAARSRDARA